MRFLLDSLAALILGGLVAGVFLHLRAEQGREEDNRLAQSEVHRFQNQIHLRASLQEVELNAHGFPVTIDPEWFLGNLPVNPLLSATHPWLEIAAEVDRGMVHPSNMTAPDTSVAQFWYNPYTGVVRARVPTGVSDATTLALYNRVNGTNLPSLFASARLAGE